MANRKGMLDFQEHQHWSMVTYYERTSGSGSQSSATDFCNLINTEEVLFWATPLEVRMGYFIATITRGQVYL